LNGFAWVNGMTGSGTTCFAAQPCTSIESANAAIWDDGSIYVSGPGRIGGGEITKSARIMDGGTGGQIGWMSVNAPSRDVLIKGVHFDRGNYVNSWGIRAIAVK